MQDANNSRNIPLGTNKKGAVQLKDMFMKTIQIKNDRMHK